MERAPRQPRPAQPVAPPPASSAEDGTSADLILMEEWPAPAPHAGESHTVGGTHLGLEHDQTDREAWQETPGGTLLEPVPQRIAKDDPS